MVMMCVLYFSSILMSIIMMTLMKIVRAVVVVNGTVNIMMLHSSACY